MVIDSLHNAAKYYILHPLLQQAFEYINTVDLHNVADEKKEVADGLKIITSTAPGKTKEASLQKLIFNYALKEKKPWAGNPDTIVLHQKESITKRKMYFFLMMRLILFLNSPTTSLQYFSRKMCMHP